MRGGEAGPAVRGPGLQSTRNRILAVLKRRGRCSVDEIAIQLAVAPMTVRHHLVSLERDDLVACTKERQSSGRPHYVYSLAAQGEAHFRRHDNYLAHQLLLEVALLDGSEITGLSSDEKTRLLFDKLADRLIAQHAARLSRLPRARRIAAATELLQRESGFAECLPIDGGWEIRDYTCYYREFHGSRAGNGGSCCWHRRLLVGLLGCSVQPAGADAGCDAHACRFQISAVPDPSTAEANSDAADARGRRSRTRRVACRC